MTEIPYIRREIHSKLINLFKKKGPAGVILAGIVGCGKTTLVHEVLRELGDNYNIFEFTGDDSLFRQEVAQDTTCLDKQIRSKTQGKALVFVDEVQKSENIFDAIKYAFDASQISFIVSGSNPDYLNTQAKKRLQRRADLISMTPFSLPEILVHKGLVNLSVGEHLLPLFSDNDMGNISRYDRLGLTLTKKMENLIDRYLTYGGLPLAWLAETPNESLLEIRKIVERGFESLSEDNNAMVDTIRIELAKLHSREFSYQGIFQKTGIRRRDIVNNVIDDLINHGYLLKKKPLLFEDKRSYLSVFSYTDPGLVTYLTGNTDVSNEIGFRVEGMIQGRLTHLLMNHVPLKSELGYYKPYSIDMNDKVKFKPGEIDFVLRLGRRLIPMEVKAGSQIHNIDTTSLREFMQEKNLSLGLVFYGGVPYWDKANHILFWPFWLV